MWTEEQLKCGVSRTFKKAGHNFPNSIEIKINGRLTRTLGRCMYKNIYEIATPYKIEFSKQFLETSTDDCIESVIAHEACHALVAIETGVAHHHDEYFKEMCRRVGCTNDGRTTQVESTVDDRALYKYFVVCKECGKVVGMFHRAGKIVKNSEHYKSKCCKGSLLVEKNW